MRLVSGIGKVPGTEKPLSSGKDAGNRKTAFFDQCARYRFLTAYLPAGKQGKKRPTRPGN